MTGNYGTVILAMLVVTISIWVIQFPFLIVNYAIGMILSSLRLSEDVVNTVGNVFSYGVDFFISFINAMFRLGISLIFLQIACGKRFSTSDLFFGFKWQVPKNIRISLVFTCINWVCMLPYYIYANVHPNFLSSEVSIRYILLLSGGSIAYTLLTIPLTQAHFLLLDFPNKDAKEVLLLSIEKMKGHYFRYLKMLISFIPMWILAFLSFGIAVFWLIPYMNATRAMFFLDLMNPGKESESESELPG